MGVPHAAPDHPVESRSVRASPPRTLRAMPARRTPQKYDPRLVRLVQDTGDPSIATGLGVPRTTAAGWLRRARADVVTTPVLEATPLELVVRVARLERRVRRLTALLRILIAVLAVLRPDLTRLRIPRARDNIRLLRAIDRSRVCAAGRP